MNAIIIKANGQVIGISKIVDIPQIQFAELEKEAKRNWEKKDLEIKGLKNKIEKLEGDLKVVNEHISKLYHEIAVDRGEEE